MSEVAIVSTSINPAPIAYRDWAKAGDLIVAGDVNSPTELAHYLKDIGATYLTPAEQTKMYPFSEIIGWRNIQRRNAAIMYAYERNYRYIVTVDDDNVAQQSATQFVMGHIGAMQHPVRNTVSSPTGYLNTGIFCEPHFHQRGTPRGVLVNNVHGVPVDPAHAPRIVVSQAQVMGDPDTDAIDRIVYHPDVKVCLADVVVTPGVYAAFNSQATVWDGAWAPVMAVLPHIGRYDDIFASFIFHRLARDFFVALHVGTPCVKQERNEHDLVKDLAAEVWGLNTTITFVDEINRAHISADMPLPMAYSELMVAAAAVLPQPTIAFAEEWVRYWKGLL